MNSYETTQNFSDSSGAPQSLNCLDFNDAKPQGSYEPIPKGTVARVVMAIKPGGYSDPIRGWHGGYATHNSTSGSVYLNCEFTVLEGPYAGRKVWSLIGLHGPKGDQWFQMGRSFLKSILNSARGFSEQDTSVGALAARQIKSFAELDGLEFVARIDVQKHKETGENRNIIKTALTKDHKDYAGHDSGYYAGTPYAHRTYEHSAVPSTSHPSTTPPWAR